MAEEKIEIKLLVDSKQAVQVLDQFGKQVQKVGENSKVASNESKGFFLSIAEGAAKAGAAYLSFNAAIETIKLGSKIDNIEQSFNRLTSEIGRSGDELRDRFSNALGGTLSDFQVLQKANELLLAGINPDKFDELAQSARSVADSMGLEMLPVFEQMSDALITGNDIMLKRLGIQVDLKQAQDDFAKSIGTTADKLSEAGKLEANRIAMLKEMESTQKRLGDAERGAADNLDRLNANLANLRNEFSQSISKNEQLNDLLFKLSQFDFSKVAGSLSSLISVLIEAGNIAGSSIMTGDSGLVTIFDRLIGAAGGRVDQQRSELQQSFKDLNDLISQGTVESNQKAQQSYNALIDKMGELASSNQILANDQLPNLYEQIKKQSEAFAGTEIKIKGTNKATSDYISTVKGQAKEEKKVIDVLLQSESAYKRLIESMLKGTISGDRFNSEVIDLQKEAKAAKVPVDELARALDSGLNEALKKNQIELDNVNQKLDDLKEKQKQAAQEAFDLQKEQGVFGDMFDLSKISASLTSDPNLQAGFETAGAALADSLFRGLAGAINGENLSKEEIGREVGSGVGAGIGAYFGSPEVGAMLGDAIGGAIAGMGADSAGTKIKKELDKILTDAYQDFSFSGNQDPTKGLFAGLGAQAQEQFSIAGDALTSFLGMSTSEGVNLGVVLANNNVHLAELSSIIESVGGSFESLAETMYMAFYDGELSILQLQDRLEELYGIIDGSNTFQDLGDAARSALSEDGRVLLAAIKAIGKEAEQLGISTFPQMASVLVNQFGLAADQVNAILASISAAGVNSINALANAGQNVTTAIGANLEQVATGQTPNNTPVAQPVAQPARSSGGSAGRSSAPARKTENAAAKARRELASLFNKVQSSGRGRELEKQVSDGIITDGAYVTALQGMVDELKPLLKQLDSEEKQYLDALKKGKDKTKIEKELTDFIKLEKKVADLLSGSSKAVKASINSEFLDYVNKFGDSLSGLEIAAKNAGIAFESMEEKAFNAFLSGSKTFAEAKKELDDARGGVAGKQGAVGEALSKYIEAGTSGGVFSVEALQGIAGEARELGATTLDNLSEALLGQGIDREVVQKLFIGFQNAGVDSLEAIEGAGAELAINLGAQLQDLQFPFKETSSTIRDMARELAEIPSSKKVEVELSAIVDPKTRAILEKLGLLPEGFNAPEVITQPYEDTALGLRKREKYNKLLAAGRKADAKKFKQNNASYF